MTCTRRKHIATDMAKFLQILHMKPPAQLVYELYTPDNPRTFQQDLQMHLAHGYVFSTPEEFLMGRPVVSAADPADIRNPDIIFDAEDCDCWHIHAYATRNSWPKKCRGLVEKVLRWMPYHLPLVSWDRKRRDEMLFFPIEKFISWTKNSHSAR